MIKKLSSRVAVMATALCLAAGTLFAAAPTTAIQSQAASSTIIADGWYYIKNVDSQKYVEVKDGKDANGANVQQWSGNGYDCQKWYVKNQGSNYITLQNGMSGKRMMDVANAGKANGTNVQLYAANGNNAQVFKVVKSSNGAVCLQTKCSGNKQALDIYGWSKADGGNVDTWEYNGLACQQFTFESTTKNTDNKDKNKDDNKDKNPDITGKTIEVSANGTSLSAAISKAAKGTTIVINGTVKSGAIDVPAGVNIAGKNNGTIDFSSTSGSTGRGLTFAGDGSTVQNITVTKASDNGLYITGSNNTFKYVISTANEDAGFQVCNGGAYNKFYNCNSNHNADAKGENADGFANKLHSGVGNYYENCVAEYNSDDGWDCYAAHGAVTLVNCKANYNGLCNGIRGDGNGFKMGGVDNKTPGQKAHMDPLAHTLTGCSATGNYAAGFDRNNQNGVVTMTNCTADSNKTYNYNWPLTGSPSAIGSKVTFGKAKIVSCTSKSGKNRIDGATLSGNCVGF